MYISGWFLQCLSSLRSKDATDGACAISSVRLFQGSATLNANECFLDSSLGLSLNIFKLWPLVSLSCRSLKNPSVTSLSYFPVRIL